MDGWSHTVRVGKGGDADQAGMHKGTTRTKIECKVNELRVFNCLEKQGRNRNS